MATLTPEEFEAKCEALDDETLAYVALLAVSGQEEFHPFIPRTALLVLGVRWNVEAMAGAFLRLFKETGDQEWGSFLAAHPELGDPAGYGPPE